MGTAMGGLLGRGLETQAHNESRLHRRRLHLRLRRHRRRFDQMNEYYHRCLLNVERADLMTVHRSEARKEFFFVVLAVFSSVVVLLHPVEVCVCVCVCAEWCKLFDLIGSSNQVQVSPSLVLISHLRIVDYDVEAPLRLANFVDNHHRPGYKKRRVTPQLSRVGVGEHFNKWE